MPTSTLRDLLTNREFEVLNELHNGYSNGEIAEQLLLSEGTVGNHINVILHKLQVEDRTQAAILAVKYGLGK